MFMKIVKERAYNDSEMGFDVILFDNTKGSKDHNTEVAYGIKHAFSRLQRGGGFVVAGGASIGQASDDIEFSRFHDVPALAKGFKIEDVRINVAPGTDGKQGKVTAFIRPFGPRYLELLAGIKKHDELGFALCHTKDDKGRIHKVLNVSYHPAVESIRL